MTKIIICQIGIWLNLIAANIHFFLRLKSALNNEYYPGWVGFIHLFVAIIFLLFQLSIKNKTK